MPTLSPTPALYKENLLKIEQNDIMYSYLIIGKWPFKRESYFTEFNLRDDFSRLGYSLGTNTHLATLVVSITSGIELDVTHRDFFEGLTQNNSIKKVKLVCGNRYAYNNDSLMLEILRAYQTNSNNLVELSISNCWLQNGGEHILATTLQSCTNLTKLSLHENDITDEKLLVLIDAVRVNHSLEALNVKLNRIGDAGCETISTLLTNPQSNLQYLALNNNNISSDGVIKILNALEGNSRLREVNFSRNPDYFSNPIDNNVVKDALSRLLCNTSSINQTYSSNHTVFPLELNIEGELWVLMKMNTVANKSHVAIRKILRYHPHIDMKQFFGWDAEGEWTLKGLPYILTWFEKAREAVIAYYEGYGGDPDGKKEYNIEKRKLLAIYEFAKAMPLQFVTT